MRSAYWALGVAGFAVGLYHWVFYNDLILRSGYPEPQDLAVGAQVDLVLVQVAAEYTKSGYDAFTVRASMGLR